MLIDRFMPDFIVSKRHSVKIDAPLNSVYFSLLEVNFRDSSVIRWLFRLRGIPENALTLSGFGEAGFIPLARIEKQEVLFGLVGRFWTYAPELLFMDPESFHRFQQKGYAKAVINFSFHRLDGNLTRVETETRVHCTDQASKSLFRVYWFFISPFSAWIRQEMLRLVKRAAEKTG